MARLSRKHPTDLRSLTGAASRLPTKDPRKLAKSVRTPAEWQAKAWEFFDTVPELKFAANWVELIAKVKLYPAVLNDQGDPIPVTDEASGIPETAARAIEAEMAKLRGDFGGQADIQRELSVNLDVAGECYLVGWAPKTVDGETVPETWEIRSVSEVSGKGDKTLVKGSPGDKSGREVSPSDEAVRCWVRHPRWSDLPDTNVKALTTELRALQVLSQQVMAESMSRASAGILVMAQEITDGAAQPELPEGEDAEQDDPLMRDMTEYLTRPIQDPGDPSSVVPFIWRVPAEHVKNIALLSLGRDTGEALDKRIEARVMRVARGMNVPVEVVLGLMGTTFANAQQISEDQFTEFLEPRVLLQCDLLTVGYLRPKLKGDLAAYADRVIVWYDASALMDPPDQSAAADEAYDRGTISPSTYRAAKGFSDEDAPTPEEALAGLVTRKGILTAELSGELLKFILPTFVPPPPKAGAPAGQLDPAVQAALLAAAGQSHMASTVLELLGIQLPPAHAIDTTGRDPANPQLPRG